MPIIHHLIVDHYGAFLGKHQGRLRVTRDKEVLAEAPVLHLQQVLITGKGVSVSADAIHACCTAGIPIHFLDGAGRPYAALYAAGLTGTILTRREQLLAYSDRRGVKLALAFAHGKIANQSGFLRYAAKYREEADTHVFQQLRDLADQVQNHLMQLQKLEGESADQVREQILSIEGRAAHVYWQALGLLIPRTMAGRGAKPRVPRTP